MGDRIKVGLIGLGEVAQLMHLPLLADDRRFEIAAVTDASPSLTAYVAERHGAKTQHKTAEALIADPALLPELSRFGQGSDEYPDRSTTLLVAATAPAQAVRLKGPGIKDERVTRLALPAEDFVVQWAENRARFPRGVDLLLAGDGHVTGLPRSTRLLEA